MNIILLGPPGTGKGTIAEFIRQRFGLSHISTGDLLREEVAKHTPIGKKISEVMNAGKLVDDSVVLEVLGKKIASVKNGFILDGFPRNIKQAKLLDPVLSSKSVNLGLVLDVETPEDTIVKRLSARRQCSECKRIYGLDVPSKVDGVCDDCGAKTFLRDDDKPNVVKRRIVVYNDATKPLIDFYSKKNLLVKINGNRSLHEIFAEVDTLLAREIGN